jgi:RHS repeat-associated protein
VQNPASDCSFYPYNGYIAINKMGCPKLSYRSEFLSVWKKGAIEKSDHEIFLTLEKRDVSQKNCDSYYAFGLTFNSYSRENSVENRYLYNQGTGEKTFKTERVYDLGLNVDQSKYRTYDYLTGRWWQVDPLADEGDLMSLTPYNYSYNNPILYSDPEGDCPLCITAGAGAIIGGIIGGVAAAVNGEDAEGILIGIGGGAVAGAITGSGVGLIAELGLGAGSAIAVNAAAGFASGAAESVTTQGLNVATGRQDKINTADVVESAAVGTATNVVAGGVTKLITGKATNAITKTTTQQVANATSKQTQNQVRKEVTRNFPAMSNKQVSKEVKKITNIKAQNAQSTGNAKKAAAQTAIDAGSEAATNAANDAGKNKLKRD